MYSLQIYGCVISEEAATKANNYALTDKGSDSIRRSSSDNADPLDPAEAFAQSPATKIKGEPDDETDRKHSGGERKTGAKRELFPKDSAPQSAKKPKQEEGVPESDEAADEDDLDSERRRRPATSSASRWLDAERLRRDAEYRRAENWRNAQEEADLAKAIADSMDSGVVDMCAIPALEAGGSGAGVPRMVIRGRVQAVAVDSKAFASHSAAGALTAAVAALPATAGLLCNLLFRYAVRVWAIFLCLVCCTVVNRRAARGVNRQAAHAAPAPAGAGLLFVLLFGVMAFVFG